MRLLTKDQAELAISLVKPAILNAMDQGLTKRKALHIVTFWRPEQFFMVKTKDGLGFPLFEECILAEDSIRIDPWSADYGAIARSKGEITWRTGLDSDVVHMQAPHLLRESDTQYWGSCIINGAGTACSGVQPYWDRMFSRWTTQAMIGICMHERATRVDGKENVDFLNGRSARLK